MIFDTDVMIWAFRVVPATGKKAPGDGHAK